MYGDSEGCCNFDPSSMPESAESVLSLNPFPPPPPVPALVPAAADTHNHHNNSNSFSAEENLRLSMEELSYHHHMINNSQDLQYHHQENHVAMEIQLQNELGFNMTDQNNSNNTHLVPFEQQGNWENIHGLHDQMQQQFPDGTTSPYPPTPDLLNLFSLPRCSASSVLLNSSINFTNPHPNSLNFPSSLDYVGDHPGGVDAPPGSASSVLYDPLFHLNLPPQPSLFRDLLQSLPHGYSLAGSRNGSLFSTGGDEREGSEGVYQDGCIGRQFDNGVLEFSREMGSIGRGRNVKGSKHNTTDRHKRLELNVKYNALRSLVPNPTKNDRASIVGDGIDYIKELLRTVEELKLLVEKKRSGRERSKRHKTEHDGGAGDHESCNIKPEPHDQSYNNGSLRSSWLQRKSKDTEVDIRIIDDEVTIKLVQRKKINLLLYVSKLLDELQLDLHHVAGGHIGNSYSFLFNTKMCEGSFLYANAIANKLIEVLDRHHTAVPPTNSY